MRWATLFLQMTVLLVGAAVGSAAMIVHRMDVLDLPLGLLLAPVATFAVAWALRVSCVRRSASSYAAGWLLVFGVALAGRPEGDFAVVNDASGYVMIGTAFVLVVVGVSAFFARDSNSRSLALRMARCE